MVVISHTHLLAGGVWSEVLRPLGLGNAAVMTFFVLSGYVIAEAISLFYSNRPGAFLVNRVLRIHPPFFFALALSILLHAFAASSGTLQFFDAVSHPDRLFEIGNLAGNALMLIVLAGLGKLGFTVDYLFVRYSWAVVVELQFYCVIAGLVLVASMPALARRFDRRIFWAAMAGAFILFFIASMTPAGRAVQAAGWIPYFTLGIALYRLSVDAERDSRLMAGALALVSLGLLNWHAYEYMSRNPDANAGAGLLILDGLIFALWILGRCTISAKLISGDRFLGDLTYPLYLNHYAISIATLSLVPETSRGRPLFIANLAASILGGFIAMQCTEPLTRRLRDRIRGRKL